MVLIGFALIAVAAVVGIDITAQNNFAVEIDAFGRVLSTTASGMFVAGIVTGLAAALGIMLLRDGLVRSRQARAHTKATVAERERMAAAYAREHGLDGRYGDDREVDLTEHDMDREHATTF